MSLDITVIRSSFEEVKPIAGKAIAKFYEVLFADYPTAKTLFDGVRMEQQRKALIGSLVFIVDHLDDGPALKEYLVKLGSRHVKYRVEPEHYDWVGASLLKTFAMMFGPAWTRELNDQWSEAFIAIRGMMLEGHQAAKAAEPTPHDRAVQICRALLLEVLEAEVDERFIDAARAKIRQVLLNCLDEEAVRLLKKGA